MKKLLQIAYLLVISEYSYSQTNTFPGPIGIGINTSKIVIDGDVYPKEVQV